MKHLLRAILRAPHSASASAIVGWMTYRVVEADGLPWWLAFALGVVVVTAMDETR